MIVDDDREDHLILLDYFTASGIADKVHFLENGLQAIEFLDKITNDRLLPRLVVLDLNMPIMNGTQTLLKLKQSPRLEKIPVIIFSTSTNDSEKRKCLAYGAVDYLVKPLTYEDGEQMVERFTSFIIS